MNRKFIVAIICSMLLLFISYPVSFCGAQCSKEGDPAFFATFEDTLQGYPGETVSNELGPANMGFVSSTCTGSDTFCVYITDTKGWSIYGHQDVSFVLDPGYFIWLSIYIEVQDDADAGDRDTVIATISFSNADLDCVTGCGDCENPNWYNGNPYYYMDTTIVIVTEPISIYITQDTLTLIDQGCPYAGVLFSICNGYLSPTTSYEYTITSRGHIGPQVDTSGTVLYLPGGECGDVLALIDASEAEMSDMDTLTIIAWTMEAPVQYDTCVQLVMVIEPEFVPLFSATSFFILVIFFISIAALFIMKRSKVTVKNMCIAAMCAGMATALATGSEAKEKKLNVKEIQGAGRIPETTVIPDYSRQMHKSAATDTYTIVRYEFGLSNWQGWTRVDNTAQVDTFWHVDDFSGLSGGLVPLEGSKSMWCGTRPDNSDDYLCGWVSAPGYGNYWNQILISDPLSIPPPCSFSYKMFIDSEEGHDLVFVEYDAGGLNWQKLATHDGLEYIDANHTIMVYTGMDDLVKDRRLLASGGRTKFRISFISDGAFSDQDGLWNTDGACIIDSITISGSQGVVDHEDFESASVGDKNCGIWHADVPTPFGSYSGLTSSLIDKDPCNDNFLSQVIFFSGSTEMSTAYPGLYNTPFCKGAGEIKAPCQDEMIVSPPIDMTRYTTGRDENQDAVIPPGDLSQLGGTRLKFTVYRDLPLANLVFYYWHVRNIDSTGCPGNWKDRNFVHYGSGNYIFVEHDIGDLVREDQIQVALGVIDMCEFWYGISGNCADHTPSPWFDKVEVKRYKATGPQWHYRDRDLFQDNFPADENNLESWVRADMAKDLRPSYDPVIYPGDSIVIDCSSPLGGDIEVDHIGARVYMHIRCSYIGDPDSPKPALAGPSLEGTYGTYVSNNGVWTIIQGETAKIGGNPFYDRYMFDLNDSLFTRGYMIEYYFKAFDNAGKNSTLPENAETFGDYPHPGGSYFFEFTCLPTLASDILYVDDYHGLGTFDGAVHNYMEQAFRAVLPDSNQPDRYDVNDPFSRISNGPGSRASSYHLEQAYNKIIWDSGLLSENTISDGDGSYSDKSNDCQLLYDWLHLSSHDCGLWIMGNNVADDLAGSSTTVADSLMNGYCGTEIVNGSYYSLAGEVVPMVKGTPSGIFHHGGSPDSFYVFGGCPYINHFDVLDTTDTGIGALTFSEPGGGAYYAGIQSETTNSMGFQVRTMWFGSSFMYIRDAEFISPIIRYHIMKDVIEWMGNTADSNITDGDTPPALTYSLEQNYPNPFNPATTFRFSLKTKGRVEIKIFNVAGQLVKVLVNEVREAGSHSAGWDGTNERGKSVASGVYFCRMEASDFSMVKKAVLVR